MAFWSGFLINLGVAVVVAVVLCHRFWRLCRIFIAIVLISSPIFQYGSIILNCSISSSGGIGAGLSASSKVRWLPYDIPWSISTNNEQSDCNTHRVPAQLVCLAVHDM